MFAGGCEQRVEPPDYRVFVGRISARNATTGEIVVSVPASDLRPEEAAAANDAGENGKALMCVLTKDSEIYVNDRFSRFEAIEVGDEVEIVGYLDPNPQLRRFVVTSASVQHLQQPVSLPDLTVPTSSAATTQPEPPSTAPSGPTRESPSPDSPKEP